ncbi:ribosomal protein L14 domain-containing protein [Boletus coccyginus]|nr:ribosomal protein L14 domain-containing protein [Boletus coccyginus]
MAKEKVSVTSKKYCLMLGLSVGAVLNCADNSGAKSLFIIEPYDFGAWLNRLPDAGMGNIVIASMKKGKPELRKKNGSLPIVVIHQHKAWCQKDSIFLYFEDNVGIIINNKGDMKGSVIISPITKKYADLWPHIAAKAGTVI